MKRAVAIAHEHDDVIRAHRPCSATATARSVWPLPKSPATIASGVPGTDKVDGRRRLERAVAVAQGDRDAIGTAEGDGHVEVVIVVEVADRDRGWP